MAPAMPPMPPATKWSHGFTLACSLISLCVILWCWLWSDGVESEDEEIDAWVLSIGDFESLVNGEEMYRRLWDEGAPFASLA